MKIKYRNLYRLVLIAMGFFSMVGVTDAWADAGPSDVQTTTNASESNNPTSHEANQASQADSSDGATPTAEPEGLGDDAPKTSPHIIENIGNHRDPDLNY